MPDFNQITLLGRLTADPELRHTKNGSPIAEYTLAVNRKYGDNEEILFIGCITWGKLSEAVSRCLLKGSPVLVSGYLRQENWTNKAGERRTSYKVVTDTVTFLERPQKAENAPQNAGHKYSRSDIPDNMKNNIDTDYSF
jgi:single-strand DNA-binding protein